MPLELTAEQEKKLHGEENFKAAASGLSRRGFMKSVATGAAAVPIGAAAYYGFEHLHGKPVKAALIGCGDEGGVLLGAHNPDYMEIIAACDIRPYNKERILRGEPGQALRPGFKGKYSNEYATKIQNEAFFTDYKKMLDEVPDIEAVIIALPLHLHHPVAIDCMNHSKDGSPGKHVLCEKLMGRTVSQCKEMIDVAQKKNRVLAIGHQRHYSMLYSQSVELINSGVLGDIKHIRALWHRNFTWKWKDNGKHPIANIDHARPYYRDGWCQPILQQDYEVFQAINDKLEGEFKFKDVYELIRWRLYERTGGGLMAELGSHQLDACSIFLGHVHPLAVYGVGTHSFFGSLKDPKDIRNPREIDDHIFMTFEFPGKNHPEGPNKGSDKSDVVVVTYSSLSTNGNFEEYGERVMGSRGTLVVEKEQRAMLYPEGEPGSPPPSSTMASLGTVGAGKPAIESGATWGEAGGAASKASGGKGVDSISRGYKEEMEDFAYCIRLSNNDPNYKFYEKNEDGTYKNRLPHCHGEVAMADAILALTANLAMKSHQRIDFKKEWFDPANMDAVPEKKQG